MDKLTLKQNKFVETYIETGNATKAAMQAYNTTDKNTAAVLGHEIGHLVSSKKKDPNASGEQTSIRLKHLKEYKADRFSIRLMQKAGYSPDALGRTLWRQMAYHLKRGDRFAFDDSQSDHPSPLKRIVAMNRATT